MLHAIPPRKYFFAFASPAWNDKYRLSFWSLSDLRNFLFKVRIQPAQKVDLTNVSSKCGSKDNIKYSPGGGQRKVRPLALVFVNRPPFSSLRRADGKRLYNILYLSIFNIIKLPFNQTFTDILNRAFDLHWLDRPSLTLTLPILQLFRFFPKRCQFLSIFGLF